jgi:hypothetical protein
MLGCAVGITAMIIRTISFAAAATLALGLTTAQAETVNDAQWGFSAAFPCPSETTTTPMPTKAGPGTVIRLQCESDSVYEVNINDFPKGYSLNADEEYKEGIDGVTSSAHGTVRQTTNYTLGAVTGRDAIMDLPGDQPIAVHIRIFVVGQRMYELLYIGAPGTENGNAALAFLNSFKLN